jgi:signal transduction histidine kinase
MNIGILAPTIVQILGDIGCVIASAYLFFSKSTDHKFKIFYGLIFFSFFALLVGDIYYNYNYRIMRFDVRNSLGYIVTLSFVSFQISQIYSWLLFILKQKIKIFSQQNIPYLLCTLFVICILIYFFYYTQNYPMHVVLVQSAGVMIDMSIWLLAIICFANTTSSSIASLTLGSLMILSADLTTRCLYVFETSKLAYDTWVHVIWASGVVIIFIGLLLCIKNKKFNFASENSLQVTSSSRIVLTSFISFTSGVFFLNFFKLNNAIDMHSILWSLPIVLIFTLIISISVAKKFSSQLAEPINEILRNINLFDSGKTFPSQMHPTKIHEFNLLGEFINATIKKLSGQLDREVKIAAQVAHDIRSPLSALQVLTEQKLIELEESKRIMLRDAVYQIKDIINNLDQNPLPKNTETQIAILLEHVLSERRTAFSEKLIAINQNFGVHAYSFFVKALPSEIKRVITNLINNAIDSISSDKKGVIDVTLEKDSENIIIAIKDNGCGIPFEIFGSLFNHGFTTKKSGSGLGLYYAKETVSKWGGSINLQSEVGKGTSISIKLPLQLPPVWFATQLEISNNSLIICVDDSISVWNAWQERLKSIKGNIELRYLKDKFGLLRELGKEEPRPCTYLVDYEFSGQPYTGLDLIKKILSHKKNSDQVLLVTSRSDEETREFCIENGILIISKFFALKIPVKIIDSIL